MYRIPMRYKILFLFITIGAVFQLAAQGRVKLTGRVYDSDNQPIELATVRVAGTTMGTMTDLKGEYQLSIPAGDSIVVIYSCLGYREEPVAQSHERCFLVGTSEQERQDVERGCRGDSSPADEYVADDRHEGFEIDARCDGW